MECIFCKVINGDLPSYKIYEDEDFYCFLNIYPATNGQFLVATKKHFETLEEVPDELVSKAFLKAKEIIPIMKEKFNFKGYNLLQNNLSVAQQEIPHFHINVIPRYEEDDAKIEIKKSSNLLDVEESAKNI